MAEVRNLQKEKRYCTSKHYFEIRIIRMMEG